MGIIDVVEGLIGAIGSSVGNDVQNPVESEKPKDSEAVSKKKSEMSLGNPPKTGVGDSAIGSEIDEYFGFPLTSHINRNIQGELRNRNLYRTWQNEVTSFIRVIPGVYFEGKEKERLVFRSIATTMSDLSTEKFSFEKLYSPSISFRPVAGIMGLNVDYKNAWGSVRKATLKWKVTSLAELQAIMPYIGTPGRYMMIEWGWSPYADTYLRKEEDILKEGNAGGDNFKENLKRVYSSNGNFDSLLGIIVNYEFTLQRDGSYEGITEVMSGGYLMEGMDLGKDFMISSYDPVNNKKLASNSTAKSTDAIVLESLKDAVKTGGLMKKISEDAKKKDFTQRDAPVTKYNKIGANDRIIKDFGGEPGKKADAEGTRKFLYVSWGYIEDAIINAYVCKMKDDQGRRIFAFDSRFSKISSNAEALRSTNPDICLIPLSNKFKVVTNEEVDLVVDGKTVTTNGKPDGPPVKVKKATTDNFSKQDIPPFTKGKDTECFIEYSSPRLLLINVDHLIKSIEKGNNLMDFVYELFKDISNCCYNYWQFQIREMEGASLHQEEYEKTSGDKMPLAVYSIIDLEFFDKKYEQIKDKIYMFNLMSVDTTDKDGNSITMNSIVKNVNFNSKLSSQMAVSAYYALNTEKVEYEVGNDMGLMYSLFAPDKGNILDSFMPKLKMDQGNDKTNPNDDTKKSEKEKEEKRAAYENGIKSFPETLREYLPYASSNYFPWLGVSSKQQDEIYKSLATSADIMRVALANYKQQSDPANQGIVPITIELELDGISGIKVGDIFTMDYIPDMYRKRSVFQVSNIAHELSNNKWTTTIKAVVRVFTTNVSSVVDRDVQKDSAKSAPVAPRNIPARVKQEDIPEDFKDNWKSVISLLDRIKADFGTPYTILSGFRDYIPHGGSTTSDHLRALAADVRFSDPGGKFGPFNTNENIWKEIKKKYASDIYQCFYETTSSGSYWIHIAPAEARQYHKGKKNLFAKIKDHTQYSEQQYYA